MYSRKHPPTGDHILAGYESFLAPAYSRRKTVSGQ